MLRPNPREQRLMALRDAARKMGLQPRLVPPPEWLKHIEVPGRLVACYISLLPEGESLTYWRIQKDSQGQWETRSGPEALLAKLDIPDQPELLAIEARANAISLYWLEDGEIEQLSVLSLLAHKIIENHR